MDALDSKSKAVVMVTRSAHIGGAHRRSLRFSSMTQELIEARAVDRARNSIKDLLEMAPEKALMLSADRSWVEMPAAEIAAGAIVRVRPGERVALDGVVTKGESAVNPAPITGESIPVDKALDDQVFAGTINETRELELRVSAAATNTTLARIIHAVEQAQGARHPPSASWTALPRSTRPPSSPSLWQPPSCCPGLQAPIGSNPSTRRSCCS